MSHLLFTLLGYFRTLTGNTQVYKSVQIILHPNLFRIFLEVCLKENKRQEEINLNYNGECILQAHIITYNITSYNKFIFHYKICNGLYFVYKLFVDFCIFFSSAGLTYLYSSEEYFSES